MIAIDLAKKAGFAWNRDTNVYVYAYAGTFQQQVLTAIQLLYNGYTQPVLIEELPRLRNAKTTKSLLRRAGAVEGILSLFRAPVQYVNVNTARKYVGAKGKLEAQAILSDRAGFELTTDETDAAVMLLAESKMPLGSVTFLRCVQPVAKDPRFELLKLLQKGN